MNRQRIFNYSYLAAGLIVLLVLIGLTLAFPPSLSQLLPAILFCGLIAFTDAFGVRLPAGIVSLLPMTTVAAYLVTGLVPAGWAAFIGTLIYSGIRGRWAEALNLPPYSDRARFLALVAINATMHAGSIIAGGVVYETLGGAVPLETVRASHLPLLIALGVGYLLFNHVVAGTVIATRNRDELKRYVRSLPQLLFFEAAPLIYAPTVALLYMRLGVFHFFLFASLIIIASLITRSLALTSQRLERRVKELDSLQAVGQVLSASLNVETILAAIYTEVSALMPAGNFYVALFDSETEEVTFPIAFEEGHQVKWRSRRAGFGLTEHILKTRKPLLIRKDVGTALKRIGIEQIGPLAASWLGVPILVEQEPIGVIAIQSYETPEAYDSSHMEVLVTIASQAAVAIQNARLYEQTDEALARRVQELASILRTTGEGILLLDVDYRVLAANRALTGFFDLTQAQIAHRELGALATGEDPSLLGVIGFNSLEALDRVCQDTRENDVQHRQIVVAPGPPERHLERTLTPVRDGQGETTGWLFVFRDISEEIELAQLREDMMHMLVHDLRSPLTVLQASLDMIGTAIKEEKFDDVQLLEEMARRGSDRMLHLVNELLDINKLEGGEITLQLEAIEADTLLRDVATRLNPLAADAHIAIDLHTPHDLPPLHVDVKFMERVLHNLVDNAIKFTPDYGTIQLWARADPDDEGMLLLGITDTGPGIPLEEQPRLFEKFQQTSARGRRTGTGLGLPFCKLAVEAHGGQIWIESEVEQGSTFIMRLPKTGQGLE